MFEFLKQLDERLYVRYQTLERNIKAASNSFYDSFLDLQEQFIKFVIAQFDIDASVRETCGALLKRDDVSAVFKGQLHIDDYTFNKMKDIVHARKLMTHFVNERCRNLPDRAVELLRRHVQFVFALVFGVLFPYFTDRPPTVCFVPFVALYRDNGLFQLSVKQSFVCKVIQLAEIRDRFNVLFHSVLHCFASPLYKKIVPNSFLSLFDTIIKLYVRKILQWYRTVKELPYTIFLLF